MEREKALELRLFGKTYQEIADIAGVSRQRIHQLLTGYRPPSYRVNKRKQAKRYRETEQGKVYRRAGQVRLRAKAKALVLAHYGNGKLACVMCGYDNIKALSIDHIEAYGTSHKRSNNIKGGSKMYRWLMQQGFPVGFQTLCMNCQFIKRVDNNECRGPLKIN